MPWRAMKPEDQSLRLIEQSLRHSRALEGVRTRSWLRSLRPRETLATIMIGTASCSLGYVALIATILGLNGQSLPPWNETLEVMTEAVPRQYESHWTPDGPSEHYVKMVVGTTVLIPSAYTAGLGVLGSLLGVAGLVQSRRFHQLSPLSAVGFALPIVILLLMFAHISVLNLVY